VPIAGGPGKTATSKLVLAVLPAASCAVSVTCVVPGACALPAVGDCVTLVTPTLSPVTAWAV